MLGLQAPAQEWRAFWADAFHNGFKTSNQVSQLVADLRAAHCNAVVVEVRKRGDAYYHSQHEPLAMDIAPDFDPLQELIAQAHDTNAGPRLEVHAWLVTYPIWNNQGTPPAQTNHPYSLHRDWLTQDFAGNLWSGNYVFDPGHPAVQEHTFQVAMDIVEHYAVDGLNFDYIRYPEASSNVNSNWWGYNPVSVARFNALYGTTGQPLPTDPLWLQFRRDQITSLLRKIYLQAMAARPELKISADTITWWPGVSTDLEWESSAMAYTKVLQDWRGWMEEGIVDMHILMNYFRQNTGYAADYSEWCNFAKDHRYNRHVVIGPGIYLNSLSNGIGQMRLSREQSPAGNTADGVCGYSYAVPASNSIANLQGTFLAALTQPSEYDAVSPPIFASPAPIPMMPWKVAPTRGHLKGFVTEAAANLPVDGIVVRLSGAMEKTLSTDATGCFGAVDLVPGEYSLSVTTNGFVSVVTNLTIVAGAVTTRNLQLDRLTVTELSVAPGARAALVSWKTSVPMTSQVEYFSGTNGPLFTPAEMSLARQHLVLIAGLSPDMQYCVRARSGSLSNECVSETLCFTTAGSFILDNVNATFTGSWSTGSSATDKYLEDYAYGGTVAGDATKIATFAPLIATPGLYDVYAWYPQGGNRSGMAPYTIVYSGGSETVLVNQQVNGGRWQLLTARKSFAAGTNGYVQLANNTGESGKVVLADAVKWVYSDGQEPPAGGTVPAWWLQYYFGSANVDLSADPDGDGFSIAAEFGIGTNPTNAASHLWLEMDRMGMRVLFWPWLPDRAYQLQSSTAWPFNWRPLSSPALQENGKGAIGIGCTNGLEFYRLKVD